MSPVHSRQFVEFLDTAEESLGDHSPATRSFVRALQARVRYLDEDDSQPGVTAETLVPDLVSILSYFESRLPPEE